MNYKHVFYINFSVSIEMIYDYLVKVVKFALNGEGFYYYFQLFQRFFLIRVVPERNIFYPELPCIGVNVHVGREPLVISVTLNTMCQQVYVPVSNP